MDNNGMNLELKVYGIYADADSDKEAAVIETLNLLPWGYRINDILQTATRKRVGSIYSYLATGELDKAMRETWGTYDVNKYETYPLEMVWNENGCTVKN